MSGGEAPYGNMGLALRKGINEAEMDKQLSSLKKERELALHHPTINKYKGSGAYSFLDDLAPGLYRDLDNSVKSLSGKDITSQYNQYISLLGKETQYETDYAEYLKEKKERPSRDETLIVDQAPLSLIGG